MGGRGEGGGEEEGAGAGSASPPIAHHPHTTIIASITDGDGGGGDGGHDPESSRVGSGPSCIHTALWIAVKSSRSLPCLALLHHRQTEDGRLHSYSAPRKPAWMRVRGCGQ